MQWEFDNIENYCKSLIKVIVEGMTLLAWLSMKGGVIVRTNVG